RQEDRAIFTQDRDFLILASQSSNHAGIVYAPKNNRSIGQLLNSLQLIYELLSPEEMRDHIEYI
ncbi:MAG: hypothetical protein KC445_19040, partial [Anaerolineales bacterium]|nr:hypothetical protein [Anaerolineales bacterium]